MLLRRQPCPPAPASTRGGDRESRSHRRGPKAHVLQEKLPPAQAQDVTTSLHQQRKKETQRRAQPPCPGPSTRTQRQDLPRTLRAPEGGAFLVPQRPRLSLRPLPDAWKCSHPGQLHPHGGRPLLHQRYTWWWLSPSDQGHSTKPASFRPKAEGPTFASSRPPAAASGGASAERLLYARHRGGWSRRPPCLLERVSGGGR